MPPAVDDFSKRLSVALQGTKRANPTLSTAIRPAGSPPGKPPTPSPASDDDQNQADAATDNATADADQTPEAEPVGIGAYKVKQGDCMSSIARRTGHFWETLWNDPANSELQAARNDPNVLLMGDQVTVPQLRPKQEPGATEMRHRFVRRGEPSKLRMQVLRDNQPLANQPYELIIDKTITRTGTTDPEGKIETPIPGDAKRGELFVGEEPKRYRYTLALGAVQPSDSLDGVQQRLKNLGFYGGSVDGNMNDDTRVAVKAFQEKQGLPVTGEADDATRDKLKEEHGC